MTMQTGRIPRPPRPCEVVKRRRLVAERIAFYQACVQYYIDNPLASTVDLKQCSKEIGCGHLKPITHFTKSRLGKGNRKSICKDCCAKREAESRRKLRSKSNNE